MTEIVIGDETDIVTARLRGRELARQLGFGLVDQTRIATAISELARNILNYARSGKIVLSQLESAAHRGLEIVAADQGPGIADLPAVLEGRGSTSKKGLGLGIPGSRRLMDVFEVASSERGTSIRCVKWLC